MQSRLIFTVFPILAFVISGCDDNPKDYWRANEPQIFAWDTSEDANYRGMNMELSEFSSNQISKALGYESYLLMKDRESIEDFNVFTECENVMTKRKANVSKEITIPKSMKVYIYDLLPDDVIYDSSDDNESADYKCSFQLVAGNTISTKHDFYLKNITINTSAKNEINVIAIDKTKSNIERSIHPINRDTTAPRPSIYFNDENNSYIFDKNLDFGKLVGPASIKCLGSGNSFEIKIRNNELQYSLADVMFDIATAGETSFLNKCRISADLEISHHSDITEISSEIDHEKRKVWSDYFNIIFDEPSFDVNVTKVAESVGANYPFNNSNYLDAETPIFQIQITNTSKNRLVMHLPSQQKILAKLTPVFFNAQRPGFRKHKRLWGGTNLMKTSETFESELKLEMNGQRVALIDLVPNESQTIDVLVNKNFRCAFNKFPYSKFEDTAERGFIVQAIELDSEQDMITIEYENQNKIQNFPDQFSFNSILSSSEGRFNSIRNTDSKQRQYKTNELQLNMNSDYVVDAIVYRTTDDLFDPGISFSNPVLAESIEMQQVKNRDSYPAIVHAIQNEQQFCTQLY